MFLSNAAALSEERDAEQQPQTPLNIAVDKARRSLVKESIVGVYG